MNFVKHNLARRNNFCRSNFSAAVAPKDYIVDVLQLKTGKNPKRMTQLQLAEINTGLMVKKEEKISFDSFS